MHAPYVEPVLIGGVRCVRGPPAPRPGTSDSTSLFPSRMAPGGGMLRWPFIAGHLLREIGRRSTNTSRRGAGHRGLRLFFVGRASGQGSQPRCRNRTRTWPGDAAAEPQGEAGGGGSAGAARSRYSASAPRPACSIPATRSPRRRPIGAGRRWLALRARRHAPRGARDRRQPGRARAQQSPPGRRGRAGGRGAPLGHGNPCGSCRAPLGRPPSRSSTFSIRWPKLCGGRPGRFKGGHDHGGRSPLRVGAPQRHRAAADRGGRPSDAQCAGARRGWRVGHAPPAGAHPGEVGQGGERPAHRSPSPRRYGRAGARSGAGPAPPTR